MANLFYTVTIDCLSLTASAEIQESIHNTKKSRFKLHPLRRPPAFGGSMYFSTICSTKTIPSDYETEATLSTGSYELKIVNEFDERVYREKDWREGQQPAG